MRNAIGPRSGGVLHPLLIITLLAAPALSVAPAQEAHADTVVADTIVVNTTDDELNGDGDCSLREAIQAANTDSAVDQCTPGSGSDVITLDALTYTLSLPGTGEDLNATGDLDITTDVTINGAGETSTIIDGAGIDRVLHITGTVAVAINQLTIFNGRAPNGTGGGEGEAGGGIYNTGTLTLTHTTVFSNASGTGDAGNGGGNGGGIYNIGSLALAYATVAENRAGNGGDGTNGGDGGWGGWGGNGGGIFSSGPLTLTYSTVVSNTAGRGGDGGDGSGDGGDGGWGGEGGDGGGIYSFFHLALQHSHVISNATGVGGDGGLATACTGINCYGGTGGYGGWGGWGGGVVNLGSATLSHSTVNYNQTGDGGSSTAGGGCTGAGCNGWYGGWGGWAGHGGGVLNYGTLALDHSAVDDNATGRGGDGGPGGDCDGDGCFGGYGGGGGDGGLGGGICNLATKLPRRIIPITESAALGQGKALETREAVTLHAVSDAADGIITLTEDWASVCLTESTVSGNVTGGGGMARAGGSCDDTGCWPGGPGSGGSGGSGGGIYNGGGTVEITGGAVSDNATGNGSDGGPCEGDNCGGLGGGWGGGGGDGGGIYSQVFYAEDDNGAQLVVGPAGAASLSDIPLLDVTVVISGSAVSGNTTGSGGAGSRCEGEGCYAAGGGWGGRGGGIYSESQYLGDLDPNGIIVTGAPLDGVPSGLNGASAGALVQLTNTGVSENSTGHGGPGGDCEGPGCYGGQGGDGGNGGGICSRFAGLGRKKPIYPRSASAPSVSSPLLDGLAFVAPVELTNTTVSSNTTGTGGAGGDCSGEGCSGGFAGWGGYGGGISNEASQLGRVIALESSSASLTEDTNNDVIHSTSVETVVRLSNSTVSANTTGGGGPGGGCSGDNCGGGAAGGGGPGGGICNVSPGFDRKTVDEAGGPSASDLSQNSIGVEVYGSAAVELTDSTVSGNATGDGGAGNGCSQPGCTGGSGGDGGWGGGIANGTFGLGHAVTSASGETLAGDGDVQLDGTDVSSGTVAATNCTVSGNTTGDGGTGGGCDADNCSAGQGGGGGSGGGIANGMVSEGTSDGGIGVITRILESGQVRLTHATVTANATGTGAVGGSCTGAACSPGLSGADGSGGGIRELLIRTTSLTNTILAGNSVTGSGTGPDCYGPLDSRDYNLVKDTSACQIYGTTTHNITGTAALLDALALNAPGDTETHALLPASPAIDAIPALSCTLGTDQRGISRPQGSNCDIGAYEVQRGTIVVQKALEPIATADAFTFTQTIEAPFAFPMGDGGERAFTDVVSGTYTIGEAKPGPPFELTEIRCSDEGSPAGGSLGDPGAGVATVRLQRGEVVTCVFTNTLMPPVGESTDSFGAVQDTYFIAENVYATGGGFRPNSDVDVYIVSDRAWTDGDPIPPDVSGVTETVTTDSSGGLGPVEVWPRLLTVGEYDIVFDANQNGVYDALFDAVDDPNHPGFVVQPYPVGGVTAARSSAGLLPLLAALVTLMALVLAGAAVSRRRL